MAYSVVFLGTPGFAVPCLEAVHNHPEFDVKLVVSQPDRPAGRKMKLKPSDVKTKALELNLPVVTPETVNTIAFREQIAELNVDAAIVVAFGQILGQKFLDLFPKSCVNVHGSLLPRWRGAAPIQRSIMEGDQTTGVCLQVMVKKLDAGAVIGEREIPIHTETTATSLYKDLSDLGADLLVTDYLKFLSGSIDPIEQDESLVTYAHKIEKSEGIINWNLSAFSISCQIRGLSMGPQCWTFRDGKKLKIHDVRALAKEGSRPGEVLSVEKDHFVVACGQNALAIYEVQPESKPRMLVSDYLRGYSLEPGYVFESPQ